ncbi:hypothetical protein R3P38DRAFT_3222530 [Favolaschia claudopus]|uniref:Uncharacterized protein n=1 Tax=Favolaschia claudopus TaxID=2862362 RepID=A0AAW0A082_9AGAR
MAVIVEVPEKTEKAGKSKGKDIDAGERSAGFAEYLRQMHVKIEEGDSMPKKGRSKKTSSKKAEKEKFMRPDSQIPNGGWFRATTSASGSPPAPPNSPSIPSSGSDDSSSESELKFR